jgi:hypothetical protein
VSERKTSRTTFHDRAAVVVGQQMDFVGHDDSRPEGFAAEERREALVGRDDEVGVLGPDRVAMVAGGDPHARLGPRELPEERVVDLFRQRPEGDEIGLCAPIAVLERATDRLAPDVGLTGGGGSDNQGTAAVQDAEAFRPLEEREPQHAHRRAAGGETARYK